MFQENDFSSNPICLLKRGSYFFFTGDSTCKVSSGDTKPSDRLWIWRYIVSTVRDDKYPSAFKTSFATFYQGVFLSILFFKILFFQGTFISKQHLMTAKKISYINNELFLLLQGIVVDKKYILSLKIFLIITAKHCSPGEYFSKAG